MPITLTQKVAYNPPQCYDQMSKAGFWQKGGDMSDAQLRKFLEDLHFQLIRLGPLEQSLQEKADSLAAHVREILDDPELGEHHASLAESLDDAITSFEVSHPKLTRLMDEISHLLSSMGI